MEIQENFCPKTLQCPLFQGQMLASEKAQEIYMNLFCKAGFKGRMSCKRFLVSSAGVKPPLEIMPDDSRSVEEIIVSLRSK